MCSGAAAAAGTKRSHRALTEGRGSSGLKIISVADRGKREQDLIMAKVFIFTRCRLDASQPRVYPNAVGGFRGMGRSCSLVLFDGLFGARFADLLQRICGDELESAFTTVLP